jgi:hypothetical protein
MGTSNLSFPEAKRRGLIPESTPVVAETHNVLVDIVHQLRIANMIAWQALSGENYEREIRAGLDL